MKRQKSIQETDSKAMSELASFITRKSFRFTDWFAERFIKAMAFLSITLVILIFFFIFREALPLFTRGMSSPSGNAPVLEHPGLLSDTGTLSGQAALPDLRPQSYIPGDTAAAVSAFPGNAIPGDTTSASFPGPEPTGSGKNADRQAISTLLSKDWQPVSDHPRYGLIPLIFGTFKVTLIAILFAAPVAILAAMYTALLAPRRLREFIKPALEMLAGFPSVVIGFFALMVLASFFQDLFGYSGRLNAFVGGFAMALAAIPVIYTLTEDSLAVVPRSYTEASLGLGASLRQTAFLVILPSATPGIFAAVLLGIGRIFGETMIALMATGNAALITMSPFDSVRTLSATIGAEMAEVVFGDTHYHVLFLIGALLFVFTFTLNALAEFFFRNRIIRRFQGK